MKRALPLLMACAITAAALTGCSPASKEAQTEAATTVESTALIALSILINQSMNESLVPLLVHQQK